MPTLHDELRQFVADSFLFARDIARLDDDASFIENRIIDSTGVLELIAFLEKTYGVTVSDEELDPDNFDSINKLAAFVERKRAAAKCAGP